MVLIHVCLEHLRLAHTPNKKALKGAIIERSLGPHVLCHLIPQEPKAMDVTTAQPTQHVQIRYAVDQRQAGVRLEVRVHQPVDLATLDHGSRFKGVGRSLFEIVRQSGHLGVP